MNLFTEQKCVDKNNDRLAMVKRDIAISKLKHYKVSKKNTTENFTIKIIPRNNKQMFYQTSTLQQGC